MPIPLPSTGYSENAAKLEALASYLETETSLSWRGGVWPPDAVDTLVGTIRPFAESAPGTDYTGTEEIIQFVLQCKTADSNLLTATSAMKSWQKFIAESLNKLRADGVSGTYLEIELGNVLMGIRPSQISESRWTQISAEKMDARVGEGGSLIIMRLLMNYVLPLDHPYLSKEWY